MLHSIGSFDCIVAVCTVSRDGTNHCIAATVFSDESDGDDTECWCHRAVFFIVEWDERNEWNPWSASRECTECEYERRMHSLATAVTVQNAFVERLDGDDKRYLTESDDECLFFRGIASSTHSQCDAVWALNDWINIK